MTTPILQTPPPWMVTARSLVGLRETPGPATTPAIGRMLAKLHAWWTDDGTPWCGTFAAYCIQEAGLEIPAAFYRARAWAAWGNPLTGDRYDRTRGGSIPYGTIVVLERGGAGHVGFYVAPLTWDSTRFWMLGGNQSDMVCVASFPVARILAVRWPVGYPLQDFRGPVVTAMAHGTAARGEV